MNRFHLFLVLIITVSLVSTICGESESSEIRWKFSFDNVDFAVIRGAGGLDSISIKDYSRTEYLDYPSVPYRVAGILLPQGEEISSIEIRNIDSGVYGETVSLAPFKGIYRMDGVRYGSAVEREEVVDAGSVFPKWRVRYLGTGSYRGYRIASIAIYPFRYSLQERQLTIIRSAEVVIRTTSGQPEPSSAERIRHVEGFRDESRAAVEGMVENSRITGSYSFNDIRVDEESRRFMPSYLPSMEGSSVKYLIVTNQEMEPAFQEFADHKTRSGVPAVVRTTEWIQDNTRNGVDLAETIRNFIVDAYAKWGVEYVLLGGDTDIIPERYAFTTYYGGELIPSDMYYSCLDGSWNADGDSLWGEAFRGNYYPGDDADLYSEVYVGRLPVTTMEEASTVTGKIRDYIAPTETVSKKEFLLLGEVIFPADWTFGEEVFRDGAEFMDSIYTAHLEGSNISANRIYENYYDYPGSEQLTRSVALSYMDTGTNHVIHAGHGYKYNMSVGDGAIINGDAWSLANGDALFSMFLLNCTNVAFDVNCIAEYFLLNPDGGAYAVTGSSRSAFPTTFRNYMDEYYDLLFDSGIAELGKLHAGSRAAFTPSAQSDNTDRWTHLAYTFLGDPEAVIFSDSVHVFDVTLPSYLNPGSNSVTVTVESGGAPFDSALVCLYKENDDYAYGRTSPSGTITFDDFLCRDDGEVIVTVSGLNHSVYADTIPVNSESGPFLRVVENSVGDGTAGNGDGMLDAGETVNLFVKLRNTGESPADDLYAVISSSDTGVAISDSTALYPYMDPSQQSWGIDGFVFAVSPGYEDEQVIGFEIDIHDSAGALWSETFALEIHAPEIELYVNTKSDEAPYGNGNGVLEQGEDFLLTVGIKNFGTGAAIELSGELTNPYSSDFTITDGTASYGEIGALEVGYGDGFVLSDDDISQIDKLVITLTDRYNRGDTLELEFDAPPAPVDVLLDASYGPTEMVAFWHHDPPDNFMVYRAEQPGGPFSLVTEDLIHHTTFHDYDLKSSSLYYYRIAAVDSCGNIGPYSAEASATTNPPYLQGWPNQLGDLSSSSPKVSDIDGDTDYEVVIGAEYMYAWHHDGVEVRDGDNYPVTWGILNTEGDNFTASPVLADLDGEPGAEIIATAWNTEEVYVFDSNGNSFTPEWPKQTEYLCWASPLVADFDGNSGMEIAAYDLSGAIYVWHADGTEMVDGDGDPATDGIFFRAGSISNGWHNSTPAFADMDQDGVVELIACANRDSIYCLNSDGSNVSGWPVPLLDDYAKVPASPVVGDIDDDGWMEVIIVSDRDRVIALNHDGTQMSGSWPRLIDTADDFIASPALADLTGDGKLEIIMPDRDGNCWIYRHDGSVLPGWPKNFDNGGTGMTESSPVIADINNDQSLDIILGCENGWLNAWDISGNLILGFPIKLKGFIRGTPVVKDLDQDGDIELIVSCWDQNVYVWDLDAERYYNYDPWTSFHGNNHNNGWYHYSGVTDTEDILFSYRLVNSSTVSTRWLIGPGDREWNLFRREEGSDYRLIAGGLVPDQSSLLFYDDSSAEEGVTYYYKLQSEKNEDMVMETEGISIPVTRARLYQNYPNPFNPSTRIAFTVTGSADSRSNVLLAVYDVRGALVKMLVNRPLPGGRHVVEWHGLNSRGSLVASGVYFARLQAGGVKDTRKMILLR